MIKSYSIVAIRSVIKGFKYPVGLRRELLRGLSGVAGAKLINLALAFISSILLARSLGPEGYGAYAFNMSIVSSLALIAYLGIPAFLTREIAKYEQLNYWGLIRGLLRKSNQLVAGISILLMLIGALISLFLLTSSDLDVWYLLLISSPMLPMIAQINVRVAALRGLRRVVLGLVMVGLLSGASCQRPIS